MDLGCFNFSWYGIGNFIEYVRNYSVRKDSIGSKSEAFRAG